MKTIGLFPMVGDLLHIGHLSALEEARKYCDYLIVALNIDPTVDNKEKSKPCETVYERWYRLKSCKYVDAIIPYCGEEDLLTLLYTTNYDIRFIGSDHSDYWTGKEYEIAKNIDHQVVTRDSSKRSTSLKERIINLYGKRN